MKHSKEKTPQELERSSAMALRRPYPLIVNALAFQLVWFACVLGAAHGYPWLGPAACAVFAALHLSYVDRPRQELALVAKALVVGFSIDSIFAAAGLYSFESPIDPSWLAPPWLGSMWVNFALTLRSSMGWLNGRLKIATVLGMLGGPLAYFAGERLGALHFEAALPLVFFLLATAWAAAVPLLVRMAFSDERSSPC